MRVHHIRRDHDDTFELLDDDGQAIPAVASFLRHLRARGCSPNTLSAYAYDLPHFMTFLKEQLTYLDFAPRHAFLALHGYARFDWDWLIAVRQFRPSSLFTCAAGDMGMTSLLDDAFHLGFARPHTTSAFHWLVHRILMHLGVPDVEQITDAELQEFEQALDRFA